MILGVRIAKCGFIRVQSLLAMYIGVDSPLALAMVSSKFRVQGSKFKVQSFGRALVRGPVVPCPCVSSFVIRHSSSVIRPETLVHYPFICVNLC